MEVNQGASKDEKLKGPGPRQSPSFIGHLHVIYIVSAFSYMDALHSTHPIWYLEVTVPFASILCNMCSPRLEGFPVSFSL